MVVASLCEGKTFLVVEVGAVGARVGEPLLAVRAFIRLFSTVYPDVFFEVMFVLERFATLRTLKFSGVRTLTR